MYDGRIWSYVHGRCCIYNRSSRDIFYLIYRIGECGMRRHWRLFVTITSLLQSMEGTCHGQVRIVVLIVHLVLSVLAALVLYVATCVCIVVLVAHLVLSVLAALGICVGSMWCLECTYVFAVCGAWSAPMCWLYVVQEHLCVGYMCCGVLGEHLVQEGSGPCKIPNFSHFLWSYGTYMYFVRHVRIDPRQS